MEFTCGARYALQIYRTTLRMSVCAAKGYDRSRFGYPTSDPGASRTKRTATLSLWQRALIARPIRASSIRCPTSASQNDRNGLHVPSILMVDNVRQSSCSSAWRAHPEHPAEPPIHCWYLYNALGFTCASRSVVTGAMCEVPTPSPDMGTNLSKLVTGSCRSRMLQLKHGRRAGGVLPKHTAGSALTHGHGEEREAVPPRPTRPPDKALVAQPFASTCRPKLSRIACQPSRWISAGFSLSASKVLRTTTPSGCSLKST
jgi:hypothetical protein